MKFGTQNKSNMLIVNLLTGIDDLDPKLHTAKFGHKTEMCSNFYEIWSQSKWNMVIMNIVLEIDNLDPKLQIRENLVPILKCAPIFMKFGTRNIFRFLLIR